MLLVRNNRYPPVFRAAVTCKWLQRLLGSGCNPEPLEHEENRLIQ